MKKLMMSAAAFAMALGVAAASADAEAKTKACWVYVGSIGDFGWTYEHNQGRLAVEKELGDKVETAYVENVPEADSERAIERLARDGCNIIFTTSFGFMEPTLKVAAKFPDVKFEHATGYKTAENVTTYNAKFHEGRYVIGQIAAKMSKAGTAGYIVSFPIPEVIAGINAFMLGAQSVNPDFKVKIVWANTWYDPGKEADAAKVLLQPGRRHHRPAYRLHRAAAGGRGAGQAGLRPGVRHDQVRAQGAAHRHRRPLGALLRAPRERRDQRHLEEPVVVGWHGRRHGADRALHQHAGRCGQDGRAKRRKPSRPASCIPSPVRSPSRTARLLAKPASRCPMAISWA